MVEARERMTIYVSDYTSGELYRVTVPKYTDGELSQSEDIVEYIDSNFDIVMGSTTDWFHCENGITVLPPPKEKVEYRII